MAYVENDSIAGALRGTLGRELVFREWDGKVVVSKYVAPKYETTPAQAQTREKFSLASRYAKSVVSNTDPSLALAYAAVLKPRQNVYSRALEDFMSAPSVTVIDTRNYDGTAGSSIGIQAIDDFRVTKVCVAIISAGGALLEAGEAVIDATSLKWSYSVKKANSKVPGTIIRASAFDIPGNSGSLELTMKFIPTGF